MTRVIHTGDTHLGYRQYHLDGRRQDFLAAFQRVVEDAVEMDVDAVVHAGDLFHDRRPELSDVLGTLSVLRTLDDADVPFLAVVGNHETKRDAQWLDLFESLGLATRLGHDPTVVGDTAFYGLDFVPPSQRDHLDYEFTPHAADHAALVAHGRFEPLVPDYGTVEWDAREVLEATTVTFDAMLLGDEHAPARTEVDGTWVTYCGSTERTSTDERDDRGYNVVTFDDGAEITRRGIPTREFVFVDVELKEGEAIDRVREQVGQHDLVDRVAVVTIEGDGGDVPPARIEEYVREQGALAARVADHRETTMGDDELEVSFADPDEAVRDRVRDLGLSRAARDLDETIRASKVADSNVADTVQNQVRELVDAGAAAAFEPISDPGDTDDTTRLTNGSESTTDADASGETSTGGRPDAGAAANGGEDGTTASSMPGPGDGRSEDGSDDNPAEEGDGQASMEEFL